MKKTQKLLPIKDADKKFELFEQKAGSLGFVRISKEREKRDLAMQRIVRPQSRRLIGLENQVILEKQVDDYTIRVVTTYDPIQKGFAKNGKFWVRIVALDKKTGREPGVFTWKTTRITDFLSRALRMMHFLSYALENRPKDEKNKLMKLESRVGVYESDPYVWVGERRNGDMWESKTFCIYLPVNRENHTHLVNDHTKSWIQNTWYYETVRRVVEGYRQRERNIRKKYTVQRKTKTT